MTVTLSREKHTVTNARRPVRSQRSAARAQPMPVVAVTGAAHGIGPAITARLAASPNVRRVIAIDRQRGAAAGVTWRVADIRDPALAGRLAGVDVVVHADFDLTPDADARTRRAFNVRGAATVLTAAAAARAGRVIVVTSAMVYGARPDNQVPLSERSPLAADADSSVAGDLLEVEQLARRSRRANPGMTVTMVRPAALIGAPPYAVDTLVTRHFESPRLLTATGCPPRWQFCHLDDLCSALDFAVGTGTDGAGGGFAVGCDGWLEQDDVERISGLKRLELPARLTLGTVRRLHQVGLTPAPAMDLRYVLYPWVVDCATLREAGWRPAAGNEAVLRVLLDQRQGRHAVAGRRIARREATMTAAGAAGATVAVLGTAAIVRRARRRHKG
jgi:nucleoside-diphosphate-sugar epimerase